VFHSPYPRRAEPPDRIILISDGHGPIAGTTSKPDQTIQASKKMSKKIWYLGLGHDGQWRCVQFSERSATDFPFGTEQT
jgi:hypothetical protein